MKSFYVTLALLFGLILGAHSAAAFTTDNSSDTNCDGSSKFSDPDDQLDEMTDNSSASSHPGVLQFGDQSGVQSYFGASNYSGNSSDRTSSAIR